MPGPIEKRASPSCARTQTQVDSNTKRLYSNEMSDRATHFTVFMIMNCPVEQQILAAYGSIVDSRRTFARVSLYLNYSFRKLRMPPKRKLVPGAGQGSLVSCWAKRQTLSVSEHEDKESNTNASEINESAKEVNFLLNTQHVCGIHFVLAMLHGDENSQKIPCIYTECYNKSMYIALKKENYIAKLTLRYLFIETFFNLFKKLYEKKSIFIEKKL